MAALDGALRVDPAKCTGCGRCELACSQLRPGAFQPSRLALRTRPSQHDTLLSGRAA
jgi:Fe-S-cluster-containing dehydrogenase component